MGVMRRLLERGGDQPGVGLGGGGGGGGAYVSVALIAYLQAQTCDELILQRPLKARKDRRRLAIFKPN